jgi:hypothetical protein
MLYGNFSVYITTMYIVYYKTYVEEMAKTGTAFKVDVFL